MIRAISTRHLAALRRRFTRPNEADDLVPSQVVVAGADRRIDARFFRRLVLVCKSYWWRRGAWKAWLVLVIVMSSAAGVGLIGGLLTKAAGIQADALQAKDAAVFWRTLVYTTSLGLLFAALSQYVNSTLATFQQYDWREWMTRDVIDRYLSNRTYYALTADKRIDNPDERIQNDTDAIVSNVFSFPGQVIMTVTSLGVQIFILWSISHAMFFVALGYCLVKSLVGYLLVAPTVKLRWRSVQASADLRQNLLHLREHAEIVAFYRGESAEGARIGRRIDRNVVVQRANLLFDTFVAGGIMRMFDIAWMILPSLVLVPGYLAGEIRFGMIGEATAAAALMMTAFGNADGWVSRFSRLAPSLVRVAQIVEASDVQHDGAYVDAETIARVPSHDLSLDAVTVRTPDGARTIVTDLSLDLVAGQPLLIVGQTGVGKSSLLRAMAGLWTRGAGTIHAPPPGDVMFLPQRPYMALGSLRQQVCYPMEDAGQLDDATLAGILVQARLPDLLDRAGGGDAVHDWRLMLSLGEQQRLAFARMLFHRPRIALLDESTSSMDLATEALMYDLLRSVVECHVSVGHRPSLLSQHTQLLELRKDGWTIRAIEPELAVDETLFE